MRKTSFPDTFIPWLAVAAWASGIFLLSAQPSLGTDFGIWDVLLRKAAHFIVYAVLLLLMWNALRRSVTPANRALALAAAVTFLYACSDEFHQTFVSGRTGTPRDVAIDSAGIMLMVLIILRMRSKQRPRAKAAVR